MVADQKKIRFIINPRSGVREKVSIVEMLKAQLDPSFDYSITFTERAKHATELAKQAVKQNFDAVIAVGGDGSVHEVGEALINSHVKLGIIPCGSGNGFARHLKIPLKISGAIQCINRFESVLIDTAKINNNAFLATAGVGFDARVGWKFSEFGKRGFLSYMQVSTNEFFNYKSQHYELEIDGKILNTEAFLICFANASQYGNNAWIAPSASLTDGKLNVCILKKFPPQATPDIIFKLFNKQLEKSPYYSFQKVEQVKLKGAKLLHMDGEPVKIDGNLEIKVVPKSLNVIC